MKKYIKPSVELLQNIVGLPQCDSPTIFYDYFCYFCRINC